jgi:hypothetical protein
MKRKTYYPSTRADFLDAETVMQAANKHDQTLTAVDGIGYYDLSDASRDDIPLSEGEQGHTYLFLLQADTRQGAENIIRSIMILAEMMRKEKEGRSDG